MRDKEILLEPTDCCHVGNVSTRVGTKTAVLSIRAVMRLPHRGMRGNSW